MNNSFLTDLSAFTDALFTWIQQLWLVITDNIVLLMAVGLSFVGMIFAVFRKIRRIH